MKRSTLTFLEYLLAYYLGPPRRSKGQGVSYWNCPKCGHRSFHTLPKDFRYKHRAKCWKCEFRGDVYDMLRHFHRHEFFPDHKLRRERMQRRYTRARWSRFRAGTTKGTQS